MSALVLGPVEVRRLLPMRQCMDLVAQALRALAVADGLNPLRWGVALPDGRGILGMMPGYLASPPALGLKVVAVFPGNHGTELDAHQGVVVLFDEGNGVPLAILDASEITAIRTAAASGVATELLARTDASELAIIGSGVQARTHLEAMLLARPIRRVRVYSPDRGRRRAFVEREGRGRDVEITAASSVEQAVESADVICTVTSSREPVMMGEWIKDGAHINAVGASVHSARELDTAAVVRSRLFVDRRESTLNESGDFLFPKQEGAIDDDHILGEIGEILLGRADGRTRPDEITLFDSLGLAVEDLAAARYVHDRALDEGLGTEVDLGGRRVLD